MKTRGGYISVMSPVGKGGKWLVALMSDQDEMQQLLTERDTKDQAEEAATRKAGQMGLEYKKI